MAEARRYTEREVATILRLAGRLDAIGVGALARGGTTTLADIEAIAADAGIDPAAVRMAAATLDQQHDENFLSRIVGGPTLFRIERTVAREVAAAEFDELISSVQWLMSGQSGEVTVAADAVTWQHKTDEGPATTVEIARRGGATRIRLLAQHENPAGWTLIAAGAGAVLTSALAIAPLDPGMIGISGIILGSATLNLLGARALWRRHAASVRRKLQSLADRLESQIRR